MISTEPKFGSLISESTIFAKNGLFLFGCFSTGFTLKSHDFLICGYCRAYWILLIGYKIPFLKSNFKTLMIKIMTFMSRSKHRSEISGEFGSNVLKNRSRGYEFAEFEKEFIFHRPNTGFVEYISGDGRLFSLNPSPCFKASKHLHYFAEACDPPSNNVCVEVEVSSEDVVYQQNWDGWYKNVLKRVSGWKPFDYQPILRRKKLIDRDQIINYFAQTYRGKDDITERIATCSALYTFSSPPISDTFGGVNAAVLSKKSMWDNFKKTMKIIPLEFFRQTSKHYYCLSEKEKILPPLQSEEVNLASTPGKNDGGYPNRS